MYNLLESKIYDFQFRKLKHPHEMTFQEPYTQIECNKRYDAL